MYIFLLMMFGLNSAQAQTQTTSSPPLRFGALNYVVSIPTAGTGDFLNNEVSFRGLGLEWSTPVLLERLAVGGSLRWIYLRNVEDRVTETQGDVTATGRRYSSLDSFPALLSLRYALGSSDRLVPYIGGGIGALYGMRELVLGSIQSDDDGWQFLLTPEAGVYYRVGTANTGINFNVRYDAGLGNDSLPATSYLSLAIGLGYSY